MSPWAALACLVALTVGGAFWSVVAENAYYTWVRPWWARRQRERRIRKHRGRHW